jgi:hypothetical protein
LLLLEPYWLLILVLSLSFSLSLLSQLRLSDGTRPRASVSSTTSCFVTLKQRYVHRDGSLVSDVRYSRARFSRDRISHLEL